MRCHISKPLLITCLGLGTDETMEGIRKGDRSHFQRNGIGLLVGRVDIPEENKFHGILSLCSSKLKADTERILNKYSPSRVGVAIGGCDYNSQEAAAKHGEFFSSGSFGSYDIDSQNPFKPAEYLASSLGLEGPVFAIASACSSGLSSVIKAIDLLEANDVDAMLVGGVDFSSDVISSGFLSLGATSQSLTNPFSKNRDGISLGDGAGLFYVTREKVFDFSVAITGYGESSDGYNMTSPNPEGKAVMKILNSALEMAGLVPDDIDYVNLHGTGTKANDGMEALAVGKVFGSKTKVSSTKTMTGHTLGAAGAIGLGISACTIASPQPAPLPPHLFDGEKDDTCVLSFSSLGERANVRRCVVNAFAFGGSNATMVLEAE